MSDYAPPTQGVTTPPTVVPPCPECGEPLGLHYAECVTCAHHASDYAYSDYTATGGDA